MKTPLLLLLACTATILSASAAEPASNPPVVALRFVALADKASQGASHALVVKPGESLVLLESHEGRAAGYVSDVALDIAVGEGASLERIVLVDDDDGLSQRAAAVLAAAGYSDLAYLEGGNAAWAAAGFELFSGVNVPSKAFGEFIELASHTPSINADELDALLRAVIEAHGGYVFKTVGDAFCAAFADPGGALAAALAAQRALGGEPWGATGPLRVRMALHSGVTEERDGG